MLLIVMLVNAGLNKMRHLLLQIFLAQKLVGVQECDVVMSGSIDSPVPG